MTQDLHSHTYCSFCGGDRPEETAGETIAGGMAEKSDIEFVRAYAEVDERIGFKYRTVYLYDEDSRLHYHDFYEVFLILAFDVVHDINDAKMHLSRGTLVFIRKEDRHTFEYASAKEPSLCNLSFKEEILQELFAYLSQGYPSKKLLSQSMPPSVVLDEKGIAWFQSQLKRLNSVNSEGKEKLWELEYHCRLFLLKLFTRYFTDAVSDSEENGIPGWLVRLNGEMNKPENFCKGSEQMVQLSGRTHDYLGRMVKKYYGMTVSEYINQLRLNYFANTLVTSDMPIMDLCFECGFRNVSYAYSLFKKKYGMSPMKYRKMSV